VKSVPGKGVPARSMTAPNIPYNAGIVLMDLKFPTIRLPGLISIWLRQSLYFHYTRNAVGPAKLVRTNSRKAAISDSSAKQHFGITNTTFFFGNQGEPVDSSHGS